MKILTLDFKIFQPITRYFYINCPKFTSNMKTGIHTICSCCLVLLFSSSIACAQQSVNDTIRVGAVMEQGRIYPMVLLPEISIADKYMDAAARIHRDKLRNDIFVVYPYAITAAAIFKEVNDNLDQLDRRHDRKKYLKSIDKKLDLAFKDPLKNLSIDQGHVLIKLIDRQTGRNCYSIIKELKGGLSAMLWQSVGVFFNNNLVREYDPEGADKELESLVRDLESSNNYKYQLYIQQSMLKKVAATGK